MLKQLRQALSNLRPEEVRQTADHQLAIGLVSSSAAGYSEMENFLAPRDMSRERRAEILSLLHRAGDPGIPARFDLVLYEHQLPRAENAFTFYAHDPVRTVLCASEHEHAFKCRITQQCRQRIPFPIARNEKDALFDQLNRRCGWRDGHLDWVVEVFLGKRGDHPRHGRREQQCLTLSRHQFHDAPQRMDEAQVEHSIRLVEDQNFDAR